VGLNLGDVIVGQDGDLYGEGINIAVRLEGLADPGGICFSISSHRLSRWTGRQLGAIVVLNGFLGGDRQRGFFNSLDGAFCPLIFGLINC